MITLSVGPLEVNCYVLWSGEDRNAVVIDPGGDADKIAGVVEREGLGVRYLLLTHGHFDHVGALSELKERLGAEAAVHALDAPLLDEAPDHAALYGLSSPAAPAPDFLLEDGAVIEAGPLALEVMHTPGHTRGGICLYEKNLRLLFTGDTLFAGSIGRTDFEGGSLETLLRSIRERILPLHDDVTVLPGHGPASTIGSEKTTNPFISGFSAGQGEGRQ